MSTREHILDIALKLFSQYGYDDTGVQKIALESGVTKPSIYHYFGNKKGVFETLYTERVDVILERLEFLLNYKRDIRSELESCVSFFFQLAKDKPSLYRFIYISSFYPKESEVYEKVKSFRIRLFELFTDYFLSASKDHGNMKGRELRYAVSFIGTINAYIDLYINDVVELDRELSGELCRQFMHGIFS